MKTIKPADQVHFFHSMPIARGTDWFSEADVVPRGTTVTLTAEIIEASRDRNGKSWLDLVDDEDAQVTRWGKVMFASGPWPEGKPAWEHGDPLWAMEVEKARAEANAITDEDERAVALREVRRVFGNAVTSKTILEVSAF